MTKQVLEQYRSIITETEEIRERIGKRSVSDVVRGSSRHFPYRECSFHINGEEDDESSRADMCLLKILEKQKEDIDKFVKEIPDSTMRRIFRYRYIEGKKRPSWRQIAFAIGENDEQFPRRKHDRYLKRAHTAEDNEMSRRNKNVQ